MFNQKVNHFAANNPSYLNYSISEPQVRGIDVHNCGTTINKYNKISSCGSLPLQTWCSKNVAVESFGMRPIVQSKDYFNNIKKYLQSIMVDDHSALKNTTLPTESYKLFETYGYEPDGSLLQAINLEVTSKISNLMAMSAEGISMFKNYNPICEGLVVTDININTYKSTTNKDHYYHSVVFSAVNTTRYNTISFKAELFQDTTPMMPNWNKAVNDVMNSRDVPKNINKPNSRVYVSNINLLNDTTCVTAQEPDCLFKGFNLSPQNSFSQLLNANMLQNVVDNKWVKEPALGDFTYNNDGNYDTDGNIHITDKGPQNVDKLVKDLAYIYTKYPYDQPVW
jgi:hypothetical protein